ncbi:MAG: hypothetical protein U0527_15055 [Candidatus Eisenbacteria bacterium]
MNDALRGRTIAKLPGRLKLEGRVLFLADDPELLGAQLEGRDPAIDWDEVAARGPSALPFALRNDISTDEITPGWVCYYADETLGEFVYVGLRSGDRFPIQRGSVRGRGFVAAVSGKRRGKGSSREQSPYAERAAGIRVVIMKSIEHLPAELSEPRSSHLDRLFQHIARASRGRARTPALGLYRRRGRDHPRDHRVRRPLRLQRGATSRRRARAGHHHLGAADDPGREDLRTTHDRRYRARRCGRPAVEPGDSGFARTDIRFSHQYVTPMAAFFEQEMGSDGRVADPDSVYFFRDHLTFLGQVMTEDKKQMQGFSRPAEEPGMYAGTLRAANGIRLPGSLRGQGEQARQQAIYAEKVLELCPAGQLVIGTDSHTPHSGRDRLPGIRRRHHRRVTALRLGHQGSVRACQTVYQFARTGRRPRGVTAKDFMLAILAHPYVQGLRHRQAGRVRGRRGDGALDR